MASAGHFTRSEILSQPEAWEASLAVLRAQSADLRAFYERGRFDAIRLVGCGSTYYVALAAAAFMQEQIGIEARGVPGSELWLYPKSALRRDSRTLLIAVSRSGETTETLRAVEQFRARSSGAVLTLSCYPGRELTHLGDLNVVLEAGQEESVAQTRAFSVLYLATVALAMLWSGQLQRFEQLSALPAVGRRLIERYVEQARQFGTNPALERFYFLGSGARYGLACELSLKMKEMSLSHSEPFHVLEYRHGPKSMVTPETLILGLLGESNRALEQTVLAEMSDMGAQVVTLSEAEYASGLPESLTNILALPFGQLLAFERSISRGLNPDRPNNLGAVVRLDGGG